MTEHPATRPRDRMRCILRTLLPGGMVEIWYDGERFDADQVLWLEKNLALMCEPTKQLGGEASCAELPEPEEA